jgi:glycosyltransferase involved in cell wall biosynthesis
MLWLDRGNLTSLTMSIIIATLNEEEGVGPTIDELREVFQLADIVVVDGRSTDKTVAIAKSKGADVLIQQGIGKGEAMFQGLKRIDSKVRYVVFTDADFTYPAEFIPKMIEILEHNPNVGMVLGNRFNGEHNFDKTASNPFYAGNRLLAFAQYVMNGVKLNDPLSGLRVVRTEVLKDWKLKSKGFDVEAELNSYVGQRGYGIAEISIPYRQRLGEKKLKLRHGLEILKRIMSESFAV